MTKSTEIGLVVIMMLLFITIGIIEHSNNIQTEIMQEIIDDYKFKRISCIDEKQAMSIRTTVMIKNLNDTVNTLRDDKRDLEQDIELLEYELQIKDIRFHTAYDIDMRPTYAEVMAFLEEDETDAGIWTDGYDCTQFAYALVRNAIDAGVFACTVIMDIDVDHDDVVDTGHAIVAFNTLDAGVVYIEPQNDEAVYMQVGMNYWCAFTNGECGEYIVTKYDSCFGMF